MTQKRTAYCGRSGVIFMGKRRGAGTFFLARASYNQLRSAIEKIAVQKMIVRPVALYTWFIPAVFQAHTHLEALDAAVAFSTVLKEELQSTASDVGIPSQKPTMQEHIA